jgi:hypothetical protein
LETTSKKEKDVANLESESEWDYDSAQRVAPVRKARAVVSVAFGRDDLEIVAADAQRLGLKLSAYIRTASIDKASRNPHVTSIRWFGATTGSFAVSVELGPDTRVSSSVLRHPDAE